ncbi:hypothetical protein [Calothrix sp. 336/3]|uniref:hypothetical protein n=1 Tax=Calothrix sp. 336/3 TaxID=1337936 RepID=UPI0004E2AFED|nr:hypothetical protein [Calothrix sp. 336/3]AKG20767.1 cyanobacterial membrane protein, in cluster with PxcA [Calothrix sp. 336/3]
MYCHSLWIVGSSHSGKTTRLVQEITNLIKVGQNHQSFYRINTSQPNIVSEKFTQPPSHHLQIEHTELSLLVLAANDDNRRELADRIVTAGTGKYPARCKTPLGFFQDEVILFWPLLVELLSLKAQFPVRLRPETEQELATELWHPHLDDDILRRAGVNESRLVRRILDLFQLAAYSGTAGDEIGKILTTALPQDEDNPNLEPEFLVDLLLGWRTWCLERGFLSYGIITELYYQNLLKNTQYQESLLRRYQGVVADDVQDYPAVTRDLLELLLERGGVGIFSFNPEGVVRLGLGADPNYLEGLGSRCPREILPPAPGNSLARRLTVPILELMRESFTTSILPPDLVKSIQETSRAQLLRQTAEAIAHGVNTQQVAPQDIVIIAPGLDAIARYTLTEILSKQGITLESLNDQRPLITSPVIRALLTLLSLIYPGLGRLLDRDTVAEMLVVLGGSETEGETSRLRIDPVRAGLIADYCFKPHPEHPHLLPVTAFERWDRLGYTASTTYSQILLWLEDIRKQQEQRLLANPIVVLNSAIQRFIWNGSNLAYEQLAALRELLETAQHYWEIDTRLRQFAHPSTKETLREFIQLLRRGTVTANPYPMLPLGKNRNTVTLATIFQYRSSRRSHRWHFWLDVGSPLWAKGGAATLFGAPFFLRHRLGKPWTVEDEQRLEQQRLETIIADLLPRVSERIYLCHSDLAVNGQEQLGPLLSLVNSLVLSNE